MFLTRLGFILQLAHIMVTNMSNPEYKGLPGLHSMYSPPPVLVLLGKLLTSHRLVDLDDFLSGDRQLQIDYVKGYVNLDIFFVVLCATWFGVLSYLKCDLKWRGCASGDRISFEEDCNIADDDESARIDQDAKPAVSVRSSECSILPLSFSLESLSTLSSPSDAWKRSFSSAGHGEKVEDARDLDDIEPMEDGGESPVQSSMDALQEREKHQALNAKSKKAVQLRIQIIFVGMAIISIAVTALLLLAPYRTMNRASLDAKAASAATKAILNETVLPSISSAQSSLYRAGHLLDSANWTLIAACPESPPFASKEGPTQILESTRQTLVLLVNETTQSISSYNELADVAYSSIAWYDVWGRRLDSMIQYFPALPLVSAVLTLVALVGAFLSLKMQSSSRIKFCLFYVLIPCINLVWWLLLVALTTVVVGGYDFCTTWESPGEALYKILDYIKPETAAVAEPYLSGCWDVDLEQTTRTLLDTWRAATPNLSVLSGLLEDYAAQDDAEECTAGVLSVVGHLDLFAAEADAMSSSLVTLQGNLSCFSLYEKYAEIAEDAICTEMVQAVSYGFVMSAILVFCTMAIISLRSAWH